MEALVKLALMTRASRTVIDAPDKFLSFPTLSPYSFRLEDLHFAVAVEGKADWQAYSEFSRIVNRVVSGPIFDPAAEPLEDVVRDVLDHGESAAAPAEAAIDEAAVRAALSLLYETAEDGSRQPSAAVRLYAHYRDAVRQVEQFIRERQNAADTSPDEAVRETWRDIEAPSLAKHLATLQADWDEKGRRQELDQAWLVERAQAAAQSALTWQSWRDHFNPDIDIPVDLHLNAFAPTGFTPAEIGEAADWNSIVIERAEIETLAREAPDPLRAALGDGQSLGDIQRIALDYRTVGLDRPWLPRDLFTARFWRLPPGAAQISDGAGGGRCPAFPIAVVFARNIEVVRQAGGGPPRRLMLTAALFDDSAPAMTLAQPAKTFQRRRFTDLLAAPAVATVRDHRHRFGAQMLDVAVLHDLTLSTGPAASTPDPPPAPPAIDPNVTVLGFICRHLGPCPAPDPGLTWPT